jgi:hypothetical protein
MGDAWAGAQEALIRQHYGVAKVMIEEARQTGLGSGCMTSKRGAVVWPMPPYPMRHEIDPVRLVLARGTNHQPAPHRCDGSQACQDACAKLCVHAEGAALRALGHPWSGLGGLHMLHVKVLADGSLAPKGEPSCWQCSREILDSKAIAYVWLAGCDGLDPYEVGAFHEATLRHHKVNLPVIR